MIKKILSSLKMPKKYDVVIHATVLFLIAFGTLMIVSTNAGKMSGLKAITIVMIKQLAYFGIGYFLMTFFANRFRMDWPLSKFLFIGVIIVAMLISTFFFKKVYGAYGWIRIGLGFTEVTIQPSEFAKVFMILIIAVYIENVRKDNVDFWKIVRIPVIFFIVFALILLCQPDLGTLVILTLIAFGCFLIPSHKSLKKKQKNSKILFLIACCGLLFLMSAPEIKILNKLPIYSHVSTRFNSAANPFVDPTNEGYQLINGLYGFARGGISGVGLGESIQKYGYLTQSDNDFILSIVVEECGIFGLLIVVGGYILILYRLFYYAFRAKSEGYKIILIGTAIYIFAHFMLNVGGVSGLIPLTGVPLLFISSGGSSLMAIMSCIGMSQSVISRIRRQGTVQTKRDKKRAATI